jgi:hypothetical protein
MILDTDTMIYYTFTTQVFYNDQKYLLSLVHQLDSKWSTRSREERWKFCLVITGMTSFHFIGSTLWLRNLVPRGSKVTLDSSSRVL